MKLKDEITQQGGKIQDRLMVPLANLHNNPANPRIRTPDYVATIERYGTSMVSDGWDPESVLRIRRHPSIEHHFIVEIGNTRLEAAKWANEHGGSLLLVPCAMEPAGMSDADRLKASYRSNDGRKHTPREFAIGIERYRSWGWDDTRIATDIFGRSLGWLHNMIDEASLPDSVTAMIEAGEVSGSVAVAVTRKEGLAAADTLRQAVEASPKGRATAGTVRKVKEKAAPQGEVREQSAPQDVGTANPWVLNADSSKAFVDNLVNPPDPNGALVQAMTLSRGSSLWDANKQQAAAEVVRLWEEGELDSSFDEAMDRLKELVCAL